MNGEQSIAVAGFFLISQAFFLPPRLGRDGYMLYWVKNFIGDTALFRQLVFGDYFLEYTSRIHGAVY